MCTGMTCGCFYCLLPLLVMRKSEICSHSTAVLLNNIPTHSTSAQTSMNAVQAFYRNLLHGFMQACQIAVAWVLK